MTEQHTPPSLAGREPEVDEKARTVAFTALALALAALMGGGVFAQAAQWVLLGSDDMGTSQGSFTAALVAGPLCLGVAALGLGLSTTSEDRLARPVARAAVFVAAVALLGVLVLIVSSPSVTG